MACIVCKNLISINQSVSSETLKILKQPISNAAFIFSIQDPRYVDLWVKLEPNFKGNVKEACMASLATQSSIVRNQIAALIATIA